MASSESTPKRLTPSTVQSIQSEALLLDVRTPAEYAGAHIEGSVLMPLGDLNVEKVKELCSGKNGCVVICQSGKRAGMAVEQLRSASIAGLGVLEGGVGAWESAGLPLTRGQGVISLERQVRIAAGALVLTGALLAHFVNPGWIFLPGFVGAGLIFAGVTDTCGMGLLLARMPWNTRCSAASGACCSVRK